MLTAVESIVMLTAGTALALFLAGKVVARIRADRRQVAEREIAIGEWAHRVEMRKHDRWMQVHQAALARQDESFYWSSFGALEALRAREIGHARVATKIDDLFSVRALTVVR